jgi:DNA-binding IclR family transcriptional regulator
MRAARPADWAVNRKRMEQAFRDFAAHGFCFGLGDWRREINAVAAPLPLPDGSGTLVVGVSGAAFQLAPERLRRDVGPRLLALVANVRAGLAPDREAEGA